MGKPESAVRKRADKTRPSISRGWIGTLTPLNLLSLSVFVSVFLQVFLLDDKRQIITGSHVYASPAPSPPPPITYYLSLKHQKNKKANHSPLLGPQSTVLLAFVVCGSLAFELLRLFPVAWEAVAGFANRLAALLK